MQQSASGVILTGNKTTPLKINVHVGHMADGKAMCFMHEKWHSCPDPKGSIREFAVCDLITMDEQHKLFHVVYNLLTGIVHSVY